MNSTCADYTSRNAVQQKPNLGKPSGAFQLCRASVAAGTVLPKIFLKWESTASVHTHTVIFSPFF